MDLTTRPACAGQYRHGGARGAVESAQRAGRPPNQRTRGDSKVGKTENPAEGFIEIFSEDTYEFEAIVHFHPKTDDWWGWQRSDVSREFFDISECEIVPREDGDIMGEIACTDGIAEWLIPVYRCGCGRKKPSSEFF